MPKPPDPDCKERSCAVAGRQAAASEAVVPQTVAAAEVVAEVKVRVELGPPLIGLDFAWERGC